MLNFLDEALKTVIIFLVASSKNPDKISLSLKMVMLGFIPYTMQVFGLACSIGDICVTIDQSMLEALVTAAADIVFYSLTFISSIGFAWGIVRKLYRTITGQNEALNV